MFDRLFGKGGKEPRGKQPEGSADDFLDKFYKDNDRFLRKYVPGTAELPPLPDVVKADQATKESYRDQLLEAYEQSNGEPFRRATADSKTENVEMGSAYGAMFYALQALGMLNQIPVATENKAERHVREIREGKRVSFDQAFQQTVDFLLSRLDEVNGAANKRAKVRHLVDNVALHKLDSVIWETLMGGKMTKLDEDEQDTFKDILYGRIIERLQRDGKL